MADTKISGLPAATSVVFTDEFAVNEAGTSKKITALQLRDYLGIVKVNLSANFDSVSAAPAKVTGFDRTVSTGTYTFEYWLRWRTATASTGIRFDVNYSGTASSFVWNQRWVDTSSTASTAVPNQSAVTAAGQVMGAFSSRAKGTAGRGVLLSADTAGADMLTIIEGVFVATTAGDLQLYMGAEVSAAGTVSLMQNSVLRVTPF